MNKEKFRFIQQKRSILRSLNKQGHSDITQAGIGDDYSRLVLLDSELAVTEGLCLANALGTVTSDVIKQYNKLRLGGYQPFALTDTVMMPENDEKCMKKILRELSDLAKEFHMDVVYGDTAISGIFKEPAVTVTMYGRRISQGEKNAKIKPDMDVVMCGQAGILGTLLRVRERKEELLTRYSEEYLRTAEQFDRLLLVKDQGDIAMACGSIYVRHISTEGVYGALWELAEAGNVGFRISHDHIPIMQETIEICEFTGDDPYRIDGCGAALFVTTDGELLSDRLYEAGFEAAVIGRTTTGHDRVIIHDGEESFLTP